MQWAEIEKRLLDGKSGRALAKAFGISESAIRERLGAQIRARPLADRLMSISEHLAGAAAYGAATARRLFGIANAQVAKIDDANQAQKPPSSSAIVRSRWKYRDSA